jgi:integrase
MGKRRTKGDGGLIQRHDHVTCPPLVDGARPKHACQGRWVGTLDADDPTTGRKRRKYIYGRTQKEVARKLKEAVRQKETGTLVLTTSTVASWMAEWLARQQRTLKPQTMRSYREKSRNYIEPILGRRQLTTLRAVHIEAMYAQMRDTGRAEATVRQVHAILRAALKDAVRKDQLAVSPMEKVDPPGTEKNAREQFNADQARTVLRAAGDDARWWLALFYGMRQGEVLGLEWQWIDFDRHALKIERTLQTGADGKLFLGPPKTKKSQRWLPLVAQVEVRLRLHWELAGCPSDGLVFHLDGHPIQPKRDWQSWRDLIDRATVPPLVPLPYIALHAARNSAASLLEAAGVPDRLAMQILGQSQVQTTHGYQTADLERMGQAFDAVGSLLAIE